MNFNIKHKQLETQSDSHASSNSRDVAASCPINSSPNSPNIKCVSPMTLSQKMYQSHAIEIAEEFEHALENNSLEKIRKLLDKVLEISSGS